MGGQKGEGYLEGPPEIEIDARAPRIRPGAWLHELYWRSVHFQKSWNLRVVAESALPLGEIISGMETKLPNEGYRGVLETPDAMDTGIKGLIIAALDLIEPGGCDPQF